jgi:hypothetical protein
MLFRKKYGSIAQLGEHLPYKQGVTGSSPVVPTKQIPDLFGDLGRFNLLVRSGSGRHQDLLRKCLGRAIPRGQISDLFGDLGRFHLLVRSESGRHYIAYGQVVQLVRTPACHAGGRRFEPVLGRQFSPRDLCPVGKINASVAQLVEQGTENPRVVGSIPTGGTISLLRDAKASCICGRSSSGRAPPCQGGGSESEPRRPLHF